MITITCRIPDKLAAELEALSRRERCSKSALMREALELRLKVKRGVRTARAYDLVKHLAGSLCGPSDLSTNPKHMAGFGESKESH